MIAPRMREYPHRLRTKLRKNWSLQPYFYIELSQREGTLAYIRLKDETY